MAVSYNLMGRGADPIDHLVAATGDTVLAVICGIEGPSYRPLGAIMAIGPDDALVGSLSSGCIEADLALHARAVLVSGAPKMLRYGQGSPFVDIQLPCGGGLDILLVPNPDKSAIAAIKAARTARQSCNLSIDPQTGSMAVLPAGKPAPKGDFTVAFEPEIRFIIFGKGPEATTFAALVRSAGFPGVLLSPDPETLEGAEGTAFETQLMATPGFPDNLHCDQWTAVLAFFHEHDWEPQILAKALKSPAFYVGAQGSRRSAAARAMAIEALGAGPADCARLRGPIGLVPSARDARTLAVSVLAEVLDVARGSRAGLDHLDDAHGSA